MPNRWLHSTYYTGPPLYKYILLLRDGYSCAVAGLEQTSKAKKIIYTFNKRKSITTPIEYTPLELFDSALLCPLEQDSSLHQMLHRFSVFLSLPALRKRKLQILFSQPAKKHLK